jgi:hypothetical protein
MISSSGELVGWALISVYECVVNGDLPSSVLLARK